MDSFNHIPPQPELSVAPLPVLPPPIDDGKNAVVDLLDVLLIVVAAFFAYFVAGIVGTAIYLGAHPRLQPQDLEKVLSQNTFFLVVLQFLVYMLLIGFMAFLVVLRHRTSLAAAIRWNFPMRKQALSALAVGVALALCSDLGEVIFHRWIPKSLPITEYFKDRPSALLLAGFGILIAPLVEEMVFRGFLYPALSRKTGIVPAVIITAAGFALLHGSQLAYSLIPLLLIFLVGVVLTIVRAVTKSVATSVLVHVAYNSMLFLQLFIGTHGFRDFGSV